MLNHVQKHRQWFPSSFEASYVHACRPVGNREELHPSDTHAAGISIRKVFAVIQHDIEHRGSNLKTTFLLVVSAGAGSIRFTCSDTQSSCLKFSQCWTFVVFLTKVDHFSLIDRILWCRTTAVFWFLIFVLQILLKVSVLKSCRSNWITASAETGHIQVFTHMFRWSDLCSDCSDTC